MSWTRRIRQASEIFKKGDVIAVIVTEVDQKRRRISLSHKHAFENPWPKLADMYAVGTEVTGVVSRLLERGMVVSLQGEVDGFVPLSQLGIDGLESPRQSFDLEQEVPVKVIEFDEEQKKIVLSALEFLKDKDQADVDAYLADHPIRTVTVSEEEVADQDDEMESWGGEKPPAAVAAVAESAEEVEEES
jgi:small subunit ribosomal protein S1